MATRVVRVLASRGWDLAVAESLTGGMLAATLVDVPGVSAVLRGGVVSYATELKHRVLGVDALLLEREGPVHEEVARQMAAGARRVLGREGAPAAVGVATTGVAGPGPAEGRPAGTVHLAVVTPERTVLRGLRLDGDRHTVREETTRAALRLILEAVQPGE